MDITIKALSGPSTATVPEDVARDLQDAWDALRELPASQAGFAYFETPQQAREFVRQGTIWAASHPDGLEFGRRAPGNGMKISDEPGTVAFRIYLNAETRAKVKAEREAAKATKAMEEAARAASA